MQIQLRLYYETLCLKLLSSSHESSCQKHVLEEIIFRFTEDRDRLKKQIEEERKRKNDLYSMLLHEKKRLADLRANLQHLLCLTDGISQKGVRKVVVEGDGGRKASKQVLKPTPMIQDGNYYAQGVLCLVIFTPDWRPAHLESIINKNHSICLIHLTGIDTYYSPSGKEPIFKKFHTL